MGFELYATELSGHGIESHSELTLNSNSNFTFSSVFRFHFGHCLCESLLISWLSIPKEYQNWLVCFFVIVTTHIHTGFTLIYHQECKFMFCHNLFVIKIEKTPTFTVRFTLHCICFKHFYCIIHAMKA